jgi:pyridoxal phosphate enzyme (YggS family)
MSMKDDLALQCAQTKARRAKVQGEVDRACADSGRASDTVTIVCVSKTQAPETIMCLLEDGEKFFGENRVQEAKAKWPALKKQFPSARLHLIGPLQSNKVADAIGLFDVIETLDRPSLAESLAKEINRTGARPDILIQVNTGSEPQKSGVLPQNADEFIELCGSKWRLPIRGLMCIPPLGQPVAPHFALLRSLAERHRLPELSMGMSADFEQAIRLGATYVRIGTAIFGQRL